MPSKVNAQFYGFFTKSEASFVNIRQSNENSIEISTVK